MARVLECTSIADLSQIDFFIIKHHCMSGVLFRWLDVGLRGIGQESIIFMNANMSLTTLTHFASLHSVFRFSPLATTARLQENP
jgi:hypothetical protein